MVVLQRPCATGGLARWVPCELPALRLQARAAAGRRDVAPAAAAGATAVGGCTAATNSHREVTFNELLEFLQEQHGAGGKEVARPLEELAHILGCDHLEPDTRIAMQDAEILLEEIGAVDHPLRHLLRFKRQREHGESDAAAVAPLSAEALAAWGRIQNAKDLAAFAKRHGATVEASPRAPTWLRVTTADGWSVYFKHVHRTEDHAKHKHHQHHKERPPSDKKDSVRLVDQVEEPVAALFSRPRAAGGEAVAEERLQRRAEHAHHEHHSAEKVNLWLREPVGGATRDGPRRKGPSEAGHVHGHGRIKGHS